MVLLPAGFRTLAGKLASLLGSKLGHAGFATFLATLLAAFAAHLSHDFGNRFSIHHFILKQRPGNSGILHLTRNDLLNKLMQESLLARSAHNPDGQRPVLVAPN